MPDWDRRRFLRIGGGVAVSSIVFGCRRAQPAHQPSRRPSRRRRAARGRGPRRRACLRRPRSMCSGITPIVTPNDQFYLIDTALVAPRVNVDEWTLKIGGMVDREVTLTYDELSAMPLIEQYVTIACVSNEVGGKLIGNALWTGVDLREVLDMAGRTARRDPDRQQVGRRLDLRLSDGLGHGPRPSADDRAGHEQGAAAARPWLSGSPHHPGPVRLRQRDQVAERDRADHARGLRRLLGAAGLVQGRADPDTVAYRCPQDVAAACEAGTIAIAGVAWAQDRGVEKVEVQIDDGRLADSRALRGPQRHHLGAVEGRVTTPSQAPTR